MRYAVLLCLLAVGCDDPSPRVRALEDANLPADAAPAGPDLGFEIPPDFEAPDAAPPPAGWRRLAPVPAPIQEVAVVAYKGEVWVLGGFDGDARIVPTVSIYNPQSDGWRAGPSLPAPMHHANVAVVPPHIVVLGFLKAGFQEDPRGYVLNDETLIWHDLPGLPPEEARGASGVAVLRDWIHLLGGLSGGGATTRHTAYNLSTGEWRDLPDLPRPVDHMAAAAVGGQIVVAGGRDTRIGAHVAQVDVFDPATETWRQGAPMPTSRAGVAAAALDGRLYVFGGEGSAAPGGVFSEVEVYDVAADAWTRLPPMPVPRHGNGAAVVDGTIYVPGGATVQAFGAVADHAAYRPE